VRVYPIDKHRGVEVDSAVAQRETLLLPAKRTLPGMVSGDDVDIDYCEETTTAESREMRFMWALLSLSQRCSCLSA